MLKIKNGTPVLILLAVIIFLAFIAILFSTVYSLPLDSQTEVDEKINELSQREKEILEELLGKSTEIENLKAEENRISNEILNMNNKIEKIKNQIDESTTIYNSKLRTYKKILQDYQKKGIVSYLDSVLKAENFKIFIRRINLLKEVSKKTKDLFGELNNAKNDLVKNKGILDSAYKELDQKKNDLVKAINNGEIAKKSLEINLVELTDERAYYEEQLEKINNDWNDAVNILSDLSIFFKELFRANDNLSEDLIDISYGLFESKAVISEEVFNSIIKENFRNAAVIFTIKKDKTTISIPNSELGFTGEFSAIDDKTLEFIARTAEFKGLILNEEDFDSLFNGISLKLYLEDILGNATIKSIKNNTGNIEIVINNNLW